MTGAQAIAAFIFYAALILLAGLAVAFATSEQDARIAFGAGLAFGALGGFVAGKWRD